MAKKKKYEKVTSFTYADEYGNINTHKMTGDTGGYRARDLNQEAPAMAQVSNQTVRPTNTIRDIRTVDTINRTEDSPLRLQDNLKYREDESETKDTSKRKENVSILKTLGNIATNMGEGAVRTGEGILDTLNDISDRINNPLTYAANKALYGKKVADKELKKAQKSQADFIKRNLTNEFTEATGFNDIRDKWEEGSLVKSGNFGGKVAQGVGGMVPSLVAGQALGFNPEMIDTANLTGRAKALATLGNVGRTYVSQLPANAILTGSSYGSGVEEALNDGATLEQARRYGLANAAIEQGTEMLTGGIPGLGGTGGIDNYVEPLIDRNARGYGRALLKAGYGALGEGLEETAGTYLDALAQRGLLGKDVDWNQVNQEALQSGLLGATTGAILNAPSNLQNISEARAENAALREARQQERVQEETQPLRQEITPETVETQPTSTNIQTEQNAPQMAENAPITEPKVNQQETTSARNEQMQLDLGEQNTQPTSQIQTQEFRDAQQKIKDGTATEKERTFVKSATEAQNMEYVKEDMDDVAKNYEPMSNEKSLSQAENKLKSFGKLEDKAKFINDMLLSGKRLDASDVAAAELVLKDAAAAKNAKLYSDVLGNISIYATEAGQNIQALSLIKKLSPTSQLDVLEKIINREKAKGNKIYKDIEVTEDMRNRILDCYDSEGNIDQEKFDNTMNDIKQELADNMGVSFSEKVRAWRYLSMLGNPKTHIRNIVANGAMSAVKKVKDTIGSAGQDIFIRDKSQKTATLKWASKDVKNLAKTTANEVYKNETTSKYNEQSDLEGRRQIFKTKTGETLRKGNERLLSKEDTIAKEANFKWAFSNYLTAQGISTEQDIKDNPSIVKKAKDFAMEEANVATFNQRNKLAEYINSADTKFGTVGKVIRGAIIPFTRTPLNIAKTGLEYTPGTGLVTTAMEVKNAPKSQKGRVLIDGLSKQITGSSLALLGYALAKSGIVTAGEDDDKESKFKKDLGNTMKYSIKLPGSDTSVDLSWLSPSSMPFFVGAEMFQTLEKQEGLSEDVILESIASTLDPLSETSVVSSFTKILQSYSKKGAQQIGEAGIQTGQSYLSQFIPTVLGQFARVFDDTKRSTYADSDSKNKISQGTYRQLAYKIPGLRNTLPAQTDYYGREKKETENKMLRALDAFVNPANTRKDTMTKEDKELVRLYNKTGNDKIVPSALSYSITYNDKNYPMSQKDYNEYKKGFGDSFRSNVKDLMDSLEYENATDEEKAKMIEGIMDYSKDKTKDNFLTKKGEDYSSTSDKIDDFVGNKMGISDYYALKVSSSVKLGDSETSIVNGQNALKNIALVDAFNMDPRDYLTYSYEINKIKADKNSAGKTINGSAKKKKIDYIQSLPLTASQKQMLYSLKVDKTKTKKTNNNVIQAIENADLSAEEKQELYDYIYR